MDLLSVQDNPQVSLGLVCSGVDHFADEGLDIVGFMMFPHANLARALRANGFFRAPSECFHKTYTWE